MMREMICSILTTLVVMMILFLPKVLLQRVIQRYLARIMNYEMN